ncbi:MAG: TonB-dependent receptor [Pseudomonadota bacterium]
MNYRRQNITRALSCTVSAVAVMVSAPGFAQETDDTNQEIVVTGSRIKRDPNLTEPLPIRSIGAEDIRLSGEPDITDVINDIPALLTSTTAEGSIDGVFGGAVGGSRLNLRGLGAARTLVLVNGQRHVAGVAGSAIVDLNSIPNALIDSVEVLTGGASQVYGSDAVTGVVNFILKEDYEGLSLNVSGGISGEGDGERFAVSGLAGKNFADGRANITLAIDYSRREEIQFGDRDFSRNNGIFDDLPNPALRFQQGDISAASTPNFASFFNPDEGRFPVGFSIPSLEDAQDMFGAGNLTQAELALIDRAANAPARAILSQPVFSISSNRGVIAPFDLSSPDIDLDGNGTPDCLDSSVGFNSSFDFSSAFGFAGGCWVVNDDGSVRPYQDGLVSGVFNQFGGDGIQNNFDADFLTPELENIVANLLFSYDLTDNLEFFLDGKISYAHADSGGPLNTFYDLLTVAPDNPFIPQELQQLATDTGGLFVTRDPTDLGPNINTQERRTYRLVGGFKVETDNGFTFDLIGNYGRFDRRSTDRNRVIQDRFFAAIDVTTDAAGNPVCRSDLDTTTVSPTTPFDIPLFDFGYFTFNPGDGQCRPANILGGPNSISAEAVDFITTTVVNNFTLEQTVVSGTLTGNLDALTELPGGSIGFATGFEYRNETSTSDFDPLVRGVVPVTTPDANAGDLVSELDDFRQNSLVFDPASLTRNDGGSFDVWEVFAEFQLPILVDRPFVEELTVNGGVRFAEYSTAGSVFSWGVSGTYAPFDDLRFRVSYAVPIRAPNISELFSPEQGAFFRPDDPCDQAQIDALLNAGDPRGPIRAANCAADGIPTGFQDPLSARFSGVTGGNPELQEETAKTFTGGFVFQPSFFEGFTLTADYWDIRIEDAISAVGAQDIVDNCYDSANFPNNQFCGLFTRNQDTASPQFLGFNFLRQTTVNFAALEANGVDFQAAYNFDLADNDFSVRLSGSWVNKLDNFFDPGDPEAVDPELGELQRPRLAGNAFVGYRRGPFQINWQTQYQGEQALRAVEIETFAEIYGDAGIADRVFIHDLNASYDIKENIQVYGGINNVTNRLPFVTEQAFPVSPLGRYFFLGARIDL